jgi:tetratricopeptide (TPR) repeat protein
MLPRECPGSVPTPRVSGWTPALAAFFLALAGPAAPQSILPPDAAVKAYQAGVEAAGRKEWPAVLKRMNEALGTGHRDVKEHFGTTRNYVDLYDPYYYRGAALMELGEDDDARADLARSRDAGLIRRFPEYGDLRARIDTLDRRTAALEAAAAATPSPAVPTPALTAAAPTAAPAALAPPAAAPRNDAGGASAERVLVLFSAGDFDGAEAALAALRSAHPDAREADLLQCLVLGTRYVLEGQTDPLLLARARRALGAWRERGGPRRAEEALLSPSLLATLSGP